MAEIVPTRRDAVHEAEAAYQRAMRRYRPLYRSQCLRDQESQRQYLEMLRHRWRYHTTDVRLIGAIGRVISRWPWVMPLAYLMRQR